MNGFLSWYLNTVETGYQSPSRVNFGRLLSESACSLLTHFYWEKLKL